GGRTPVSGRYQLLGGNRVGFQVDAYDPGRALVLDPLLSYSTYLGGASVDYGYGIAADLAGNAYVTGPVNSAHLPTAGPLPGSLSGTYDAFVTKLNADGTGLVYSTYWGGNSSETGRAIALDAAGDAFVTGITSSTNFATTAGAFQTAYGGGFSDA